MREINIHCKLLHENIVRLYSNHEDDTHFYLIMEYVSKGTLYQMIKINNGLEEKQAFKYFIQVVAAVNFLHENNLIHRDLKPENLLLDENDCVKLCDFGWCVELNIGNRVTFCGTFEYMAPELIKELPYNHAIDVWSLGVLLYELIHGYSPFRAQEGHCNEDYTQIFKNILRNNLKVEKKISDDCSDLIKKLLTPDNQNRIKIKDIFRHPWVVFFEEEYKHEQLKKHKLREEAIRKTQSSQLDEDLINVSGLLYNDNSDNEVSREELIKYKNEKLKNSGKKVVKSSNTIYEALNNNNRSEIININSLNIDNLEEGVSTGAKRYKINNSFWHNQPSQSLFKSSLDFSNVKNKPITHKDLATPQKDLVTPNFSRAKSKGRDFPVQIVEDNSKNQSPMYNALDLAFKFENVECDTLFDKVLNQITKKNKQKLKNSKEIIKTRDSNNSGNKSNTIKSILKRESKDSGNPDSKEFTLSQLKNQKNMLKFCDVSEIEINHCESPKTRIKQQELHMDSYSIEITSQTVVQKEKQKRKTSETPRFSAHEQDKNFKLDLLTLKKQFENDCGVNKIEMDIVERTNRHNLNNEKKSNKSRSTSKVKKESKKNNNNLFNFENISALADDCGNNAIDNSIYRNFNMHAIKAKSSKDNLLFGESQLSKSEKGEGNSNFSNYNSNTGSVMLNNGHGHFKRRDEKTFTLGKYNAINE